MSLKSFWNRCKEGLLTNNPLFVQVLGTCPSLATTTSVSNAIGMGLAATAVLICSNLFISLLRKFIPKQVRIAAYIVIISAFVSAVEMVISAFLPALNESLGVFIPLIVVNCIILARAEAYASKNAPLPSAIDGLVMGAGFTFALFCVGTVREILGAGTFMGVSILGAAYEPMLFFALPCGAFVTLGCLMATMRYFLRRSQEKQAAKMQKEEGVA